MKVFRDIVAAMLIGIMGGLLVTTWSYYNKHKEGGITQTLLAVANSFNEVSKAYGGEDNLTAVNYDTINETVQSAFEKIENGEVDSVEEAVLGSLFEKSGSNGDVLMMDGTDGGIDEGTPYSGILRFHVRANSDTEEDQALKMAVKEDVVTMLKPLLEECADVSESKQVIVANLQNIYTTAVNTITEQGYDYPAKVYVTEEEFPAKTYGDLTFPAGKYQALRVDIGKAEGQNWWCVMFPPLCFVDESTAVVDANGKEMLKENLTKEEYEALFANGNIEGKSKIWEWIKSKTR
ncbi:MAG: stage II sporulation protein R [Lachnospiraceae bacterium]|nr:stage II sporulation protein R [Lachnospiraceae bacterium]HCJ08022.1 stage II sporulation protein R [Lachnospiraceae bacterium]